MCNCGLSECPRPIPLEGKGHVHADLMAEYAKDAQETDKPWERWEFYSLRVHRWEGCISSPSWRKDVQFRSKPRTININGYEVPEPIKIEPDSGEQVFYPSLVHRTGLRRIYDKGSDFYRALYLSGCLHTTEKAAELHAKALLSFTCKE